MEHSNLFTVSRVRTFNTCPRQHYYRYILGYAPKEKAAALARGTEVHERLASVYLGEDKDSPLAHWHWKYDDLEPVAPIAESVEKPIIVADSGVEGLAFGGVLDLIAVNRTSGKFWIVDHKSVERMYSYPIPYALEQLSSYRTLASKHGINLDFAGGCISRIVIRPTAYQFALGYILRHLKIVEDLNVTRTNLRQIEKLLIPPRPRKVRGKSQWLPHRARQRSVSIRRYDDDNQMIKSLTYIGNRREGTLIHIERMYLPISRETEDETWDHTQISMVNARSPQTLRTPGFHCNMCPFLEACPKEIDKPIGSMIDPEKFEYRPPNEEVLLALERSGDTGHIS